MSLTPGTRIGSYEVLSSLGAGGMGEVYRATDSKLKREVALKVLPADVANDRERLARFQREAEVLASLNHPNIAHIHGLEESGNTIALVMELVEGEDLSERIRRGPIPLDEVLPIAKQIAEALEAAHDAGIIHRDLKPANVKVRPDGAVKVLDFGLAKAIEQGSGIGHQGSAQLANSPTITSPAMTMRGVILGTAAYMSPEQAKGRPVDRRADLWAFGAVLFEMLTGQRAFRGEDTTDTIVAVVSKEPDWSALPAETPPSIRRLLARCLEKDRKRRLDSAAGARLEIEDTNVAPLAVARPGRPSERRALITALAISIVAMIAMAVPTLRHLRETPSPAPAETRLEIVTPGTDRPSDFALSPDGRQIVFAAFVDGIPSLWVRALASTTARPLAGTEGATYPFWSPDGRSIGFFADALLKRTEVAGGAPQTLAPAANARGGSWNADGVILFSPSPFSPLFRIAAAGGEAVAATAPPDRSSGHRFPFFLPDGRHFVLFETSGETSGDVHLASLDSSTTTRLTTSEARAVYLPGQGGWLLWVRAGTLVAQQVDLEQRTLIAESVTVSDTVLVDSFFASAVSVSATGVVAYRTGSADRRQLTWVDRSGKPLGTLGAPGNVRFPSISPDGGRVAVARTVQGNSDVWLLEESRLVRFTFDASSDREPIWSPDGSRIVFGSERKEARNLYQKRSSGAGVDELLHESSEIKMATDWSADGRFVVFDSNSGQGNLDMWVLPLEGDRTPRVFLKTHFSEGAGRFSPDGRWVAYQSNESGRPEIYVRPFVTYPTGATNDPVNQQLQISTSGGIYPVWRKDGRELYYIAPNGDLMAAPITTTGGTIQSGAPIALFATRIFGGGAATLQGRQYDVARDGRFLINTMVNETTGPITLLQNWAPARQ